MDSGHALPAGPDPFPPGQIGHLTADVLSMDVVINVWDANLAASFLLAPPTNQASRDVRDQVIENIRAALRAMGEEAA